ncbi:winged helix-turn-helix domain-containing protein [Paenibacillus methanolicus]|uniref:Transcriptional regulator n=1 Tax=Paenibacillus methanolicus TaxID=582686 RepID=A0A5S5CBR8_9BACL|nr:winged helix-turn-helix domain-containing protein [Paenibacillus methanolicus]TYP75443.1 transcriptional regulator [Paenibacillus methanolicus]
MRWEDGTYTVTWQGRALSLLPKEYGLLRYLHRHAGQTLSREQLLDGVWAMESPTDRTVDDHVYRLRRKLEGWSPGIRIETIRGRGYRLIAEEPPGEGNPLPRQAAFSEDMKSIAGAYLRYGRGDALLTLSRNREVLGFEADPSFALLLRMMEGRDVRFITREEGAFADRAFLLLYLYQFLQPFENRAYVERALERRVLPPVWHAELATMAIISMRMDWGEWEAAREKQAELAAEAERNGWEGLIPYAANLRLEYVIRAGRWTEIAEASAAAARQLARYPYQRETGHYRVLTGIAAHREDAANGLASIDEGLELLRQSRFLANQMNAYHTVLAVGREPELAGLRVRYAKEWKQLADDLGLTEIEGEIRSRLRDELGFV